uniref:Carboxymuconolactone decarboxylase family protein n=1 Tax=Anisakis simplex TaxID=6269 RepID=A0A0M3JKN3_ANISI
LVLDDKPEKVTEAMLLFLQGLGLFPTLNVLNLMRKMSSAQAGYNVGEEQPSVVDINEVNAEVQST